MDKMVNRTVQYVTECDLSFLVFYFISKTDARL
jgi:hypothetical protein